MTKADNISNTKRPRITNAKMSNMMAARFRKDDIVIYTDKDGDQWRGMVQSYDRPEGTDFFAYNYLFFYHIFLSGIT